jgi:pyrroloquinoline quinone biosynthesis protein D
MSSPSPDARPRLAPGCRLSDAAAAEGTLLMPERAMKLNGPGLEIVRRCDGRRTLLEIAQELQSLYPGAPLHRIQEDAALFLERLWEKRAVDFE